MSKFIASYIFQIGIHSIHGWTANTKVWSHKNMNENNDEKHIWELFEKNPKRKGVP